jgi:hypothetical protein
MGFSTKDSSSMLGHSSFKITGASFKLFTFFLVAFSCLSSVLAVPTASKAASSPATDKRDVTSLEHRELATESYDALLPREIEDIETRAPVDDHDELAKRESAGLLWGPVIIGNLRLYVTKPHDGYAGPKFSMANHVNFHVDKKGPGPKVTWPEVVNLHIVKYSSGGGRVCLYMWDSVTRKVVFDNCFDDFGTAARQAAQVAKQYVDDLLSTAGATVAILAALVVALVQAIGGLGVAGPA